MSPDTDKEGHGDEHYFPEQEEKEQVKREKDANDADFQHKQQYEKFFYAMADAAPGGENGNGRKESGQQHEKQADAVDANVIVDRGTVNPRMQLFERVALDIDGHVLEQQQGERELGDGDCQGEASNPFVIVAAQQKEQQAANGWEENQNGKQARH
jgi:hypothetical protein